MKKKIIALIALLVLVVAAAAWWFWPKPVHLDAQGWSYRLGGQDAQQGQAAKVVLDGEVWRDWTGKRTFSGTIEVEGHEAPAPEGQRKIQVRLDEGPADRVVVYGWIDQDGPHTEAYGALYANRGMDKIALRLFESEGMGKGWSSASGLIVSAPASDREEALNVANELMEKDMQGEILK
ncbi:hypothetical protein CDO73_06620 [Saccharibacillus sp. O23]|uniref:hypothetical protein n=1 Tax=Saccharibacillus sp. O23 TaxID=2009338 RepID=UPI000B4E5D3F|nr:hypothetical protein [Saccharibacillus sp. O23]OWR31398.1 hypothetical protein CDO73_06620 [Saccharibacillus sp. O23]